MHPYRIRPLTLEDREFLWEIVYHAIYVPQGVEPPPRSIVHDPDVAKYVREWGRYGDYGLVVEDRVTEERIGAAWLRLFPETDPGYGFVADNVPELSIALLPEFRGQGIGTELMNRIFEHARTLHPAVSLSVVETNPALRLYERLGFQRVGITGNSVTATLRFD